MKLIARSISANEIELFKSMLVSNPRIKGQIADIDKIDQICAGFKTGLENDARILVLVFDNGVPVAYTTGIFKPDINGWAMGLTGVAHSNSNFKQTMTQISPGLDLLFRIMESRGYYKFWDITTRRIHELMRTYFISEKNRGLRYDFYDEFLIKKSEKSNVKMWDSSFVVNDKEDMIVRMYIMKQEFIDQYINWGNK